MTFLNQYNHSGANIYHTVEIEGNAFVLGYDYDPSETPKYRLYIAKLDASGKMLWSKRFAYANTSIGGSPIHKLHFVDIKKVDSQGNLLLLARDFDNVLLLKLTPDGDLIWSKKYYDRSDTPLAFSHLSIQTKLHQISPVEMVLVISDIHSYNGGVRKIDYKFFKIAIGNGAVVKTNVLASENPYWVVRDQIMYNNTIILSGGNGLIFKVDKNLEIEESYQVSIANNPGGYHNFHFYHSSDVNTNIGEFSLLGAYASPNGFNTFLVDVKPTGIRDINTVYTSDTYFHQSYGNIEREDQGYQFCKKGVLHQLNNNKNLEWSKEIRLSSVNRQVIPVDYDKDNYIYAQYSKNGVNGYYVIGKTKDDFSTCETQNIDASYNFETLAVEANEIRLLMQGFNPVQYTTPQIIAESLNFIPEIKLCETVSSPPKPDIKISTIHANPTCIVPNGVMQSIISVKLYDTEGNAMTVGGENVSIQTTEGQLSSVTDHGNGTYSASLTGTVDGVEANVTFTVDGAQSPNSVNVTISTKCRNNTVSKRLSKIMVKPACITPSSTANGSITIQLYDTAGNIITSGGYDILIYTNLGEVVGLQDLNNGSYIADFFSETEGIATITFSINGELALQSATITVSKACGKEEPNPDLSTITASPTCITPSKGSDTSTITVQLVDGNGNLITSGGHTVQIQTNYGNITATTDHGDGTYSANLNSSNTGTAFITFSVNGVLSQNFTIVTISKNCGITISPDPDQSTITAQSDCIRPNENNQITVALYDQNGNPILVGGDNVVIQSSIGQLTSVIDHNNGTYTAAFSSAQAGIAVISFLVNGQMSANSVSVVISRSCGIQPDVRHSTITASSPCIPSNGTEQATITVQLYDTDGNPINTGGENIAIQTSLGSISFTNDNGNGTYTALLSHNASGSATITFTINGLQSPNSTIVVFSNNCDGESTLDLNASTIVAIPSIIQSNGVDTSTVCVQLVDTSGNPITTNSYSVEITTNFGSITLTTFDVSDGQYKAELTGTTDGLATVGFIVNTVTASNTDTVTLTSDSGGATVDLNVSTIVASPNAIEANGTSTSTITVTLLDSDGNPVSTSLPVQVVFANGMTFSANLQDTTGSGNIYTATLQSSTIEENVIVSFTVGGQEAIGNTATVNLYHEIRVVPITEITSLQSPNFYMQAAGSLGEESTLGIHLRWMFRGTLGEKHLPKRNYATTNYNFNKPNDVVKVYRAPYVKQQVSLNLHATPNVVDNTNALWIFRPVAGREFYVYFRNIAQYNIVRASINPLTNPAQFIQNYGNELIEIENKTALFFAAELLVENNTGSSSLQTESLYVSENILIALKTIGNRKTFSASELNNVRIVCENGRSIRYRAVSCNVSTVKFELYEDFIRTANETQSWEFKGDYGLTLEDGTAFNGLEPVDGSVHGHWQRYNDDAYVNTQNYKDKWSGPVDTWDRNIKQIVQNFIALSDEDADNPAAVEAVPISDNDTMDISNLDMLNLAAYDYHVARMLGLGFLDLDSQATSGNQYIYVTEYTTFGNLEDGLGAREVQHLSMSLPTSTNEQRLPLAIDLEEIIPGAFVGNDADEAQSLTAEDGYSHDGRYRFVSLHCYDLPEDEINVPFYNISDEIDRSTFTFPLYAGLEYRKNEETTWQKPELSHDLAYLNAVPAGDFAHAETLPILFPEPNHPLYVHRQKVSGTHYYNSYGINWFSRAVSGNTILTIDTDLRPVNPLVPPSNTKALLIRQESPLLLTSVEEQTRLAAITGDDKTLVRLTFNYHSAHELINYNIDALSIYDNSELELNTGDADVLFPDNQEVFASHVDVFFRNQIPNQINGQIVSIQEHPSNPILAIITTQDYYLASINQNLEPTITEGTEGNYIGGTIIINEEPYVIHEINTSATWPIFTVYKREISTALVMDTIPSADAESLQIPQMVGDALFMAVENMLNTSSWEMPGITNPHTLQVNVKVYDEIHREVIEYVNNYGETERKVEKTRGIWNSALIEEVLDPTEIDTDGNVTSEAHQGKYKITINESLAQHPQHSETGDSVEWHQGIIRVHTEESSEGSVPSKTRKMLHVLKIENIGAPNVIVYAKDPTFSLESSYDPIVIGDNIDVNFYPGYKVYLHKNTIHGLTETNTLPQIGEGIRNSIFGFRSEDSDQFDVMGQPYRSKISVPALMFAQEIIEPQVPTIELPEGFIYATRPDFFGRSTFTFNVGYAHQPHGVLFYRSSDEALLNALYTKEKIKEIKTALKDISGVEHFIVDRWRNFLDFDALAATGDYAEYVGYKFPEPDKPGLFEWANGILTQLEQPLITATPGSLRAGNPQIVNFVKGAILNAFVSLTEVPIIYEYIKEVDSTGEPYQPINKKQIIRDENGHVLSPTHEDFDMAPMMRVSGTSPHSTVYTDFNLDGTSDNLYFYAVREVGSRMKLGEFSPFLGPVKQVNTNAPEAPEVKRIMPVLENQILGITPSIQFEINAYPSIQNVKKLSIYRTMSRLDAQSIRTMKLVKTVDLTEEGILDDAVWKVYDTFEDLEEVPYKEALFYRVTASREIEYADKNGTIVTEYAPSKASKIVASFMAEVSNPASPVLNYYSEPITETNELHEVTLHWQKTCYKGKYHVYQMNKNGNWAKIFEIQSNMNNLYIPLHATTLESATLATTNADNNPLYHHFKVIAENTSGMFSTEEHILTIYDESTWQYIGGISLDGTDGMILEGTFVVRPNE
ncbi:Ig-like domain-containing protein [uncultured Kordia sp.]|uniref:Ig-like domain-containing protein n=1 Tax=uncultured Kordia sp. TaxID=507699 RepID=UPI0026016386|nr:Ig-like domain-containing protein [uncultured Kordia sp.]